MKNFSQTLGFLLFVLLPAVPASAKIGWGGSIGISRSALVQRMDMDYRSGARVGANLGALLDIHLRQRFSLRPELLFAFESGSFLSEKMAASGEFGLKNELSSYALQIPVNLAYNIPISGVRMTVFAGPALDFKLHSKVKGKQLLALDEGATPFSPAKVRDFDLDANAGIAVEYRGLFFSIRLLGGFLDRRAERLDNTPSVHQNSMTFSLGYIFR
ncbi:MAG: PorT family protein [Tannerella sp.]|jgi:hypothetical protein|nr:PorT family protein [Tannerella sp.]